MANTQQLQATGDSGIDIQEEFDARLLALGDEASRAEVRRVAQNWEKSSSVTDQPSTIKLRAREP